MGRHASSAGGAVGLGGWGGGVLAAGTSSKESSRLGLASCLDTTRSSARSVTVDVSAHGRRPLTRPAARTGPALSARHHRGGRGGGGDADSFGSEGKIKKKKSQVLEMLSFGRRHRAGGITNMCFTRWKYLKIHWTYAGLPQNTLDLS